MPRYTVLSECVLREEGEASRRLTPCGEIICSLAEGERLVKAKCLRPTSALERELMEARPEPEPVKAKHEPKSAKAPMKKRAKAKKSTKKQSRR